MPWVRIDDEFPEHPKLLKAGPLAMLMQVAALCYCNRHLTDGFIPEGKVATLINLDGLGDWRDVLSVLLREGIWECVDGGYQVHDYLDYQPSREQVLAEREAAKKRMANIRGRSEDVRGNFGRTSDQVLAKFNGPVPVPNNISLTRDNISHDTQGEKEFANANSLPSTELPSPPPEPMPTQLRPCPKPVKADKPAKKTKREFRPEAWDLAREIVEDMRRNDRLPARGDDTLRYASVIDSMLRARDSPVEPEDVREAWKWAKTDREHAAIRTRAKGFADCIKAYLAAKKQECQYHNPAHRDVTEEALREAAEIDWGDEEE